MGFFSTKKKTVSEREMRDDVRSTLYSKGLKERELNEVAMIFRADLSEREESQKGIDVYELEQGIIWMRKHLDMHHLSSSEIDTVESVLKSHL